MGTYCKTVKLAGSGGTKGTYSTVGTIELNSDAREVLALIAIAAVDKLTTIEGAGHVVRLLSSDLGIGTQYFAFGNTYGNGVATHEECHSVSAEYIPLSIPCKGKEDIEVEYSFAGAAVTENQDIAVGILYRDSEAIPNINKLAINLGAKAPSRGGLFEDIDNATITSTIFSAAGKKIPSWATAISNILCYPVLDQVPVVDEPGIAKYIFRSTMPKFEPQEYPGCVGWSGGLGTAIIGVTGHPVFPYPVYIPTRGKAETIYAYSELTVAGSANIAHVANPRFV